MAAEIKEKKVSDAAIEKLKMSDAIVEKPKMLENDDLQLNAWSLSVGTSGHSSSGSKKSSSATTAVTATSPTSSAAGTSVINSPVASETESVPSPIAREIEPIEEPSIAAIVEPIEVPPLESLHSVDESGSEEIEADHYQPSDLILVVIPVAACMLFVVLMIALTTAPGPAREKPVMLLTPYKNEKGDSLGTKTWKNLTNVGILISVVVILTFTILGLYLCYCYKLLMVIMAVPVVVVNLVFSWIYLHKIFTAMNIPLDHITAAILVFNFGIVGCISILGRTPKILQQIYLLYLCGIMAIVYIDFMPSWTVWMFLGALAIWDLIAVLTPCGPLKILVETVQTREHNFIPAMIYTTAVYTMADTEEPKESDGDGKRKEKKLKEKKVEGGGDKKGKEGKKKKEKRRLRLGLGDFVFYSLLTGKGAQECMEHREFLDWTVILACFFAILMGLLGTIILLVMWKKALPALPISIALGLAFYFSAVYVMSPFCEFMNANQVFV